MLPTGPLPPVKSPEPLPAAQSSLELWKLALTPVQLPPMSLTGAGGTQVMVTPLKLPAVAPGVGGTLFVSPVMSLAVPRTTQAPWLAALADTALSVVPPMMARLATAARLAAIFFLLIMQFPP